MRISKVNIPYTIFVSFRNIRTGDRLAADCHNRNGRKVASKGDEVTEKLKRQMKNMDVRKAWLKKAVAAWMPPYEAHLKNYDVLETIDTSPLHYQVLLNFQGSFSTDGVKQLLNELRSMDVSLSERNFEGIGELVEEAEGLSNKETKIRGEIEKMENEQLRNQYYELLSAERPDSINPGEIKKGRAGLGRKIQTYLEDLNALKDELSKILLNMDETTLAGFFELEEIDDETDRLDFMDSFGLFEQLFAPADHEDDELLETLFSNSRRLLRLMFYARSLDVDLLNELDHILWEEFTPDINHWFMALGQPGELRSYLLTHGVNTAILVSQLYNASDRTPSVDTRNLTLACIIKDIGMALLPQSYFIHEGDLNKKQSEKLHIHPLLSKEFIQDITSGFGEAIDLVERHHENLRGSGYPLGTSQLDQDQRLLNLCDRFDAMTSPRMWRSAIPPAETLQELKTDEDELDTFWLNHLIKEIGIYPAGTVVRLNDGQPAVVVDVNSSNPTQPSVVPLKELMGNGESPDSIDLETSDLTVQSGGTSRKAPKSVRKKLLN